MPNKRKQTNNKDGFFINQKKDKLYPPYKWSPMSKKNKINQNSIVKSCEKKCVLPESACIFLTGKPVCNQSCMKKCINTYGK